jgi:hypothetical protein
VHRVVATAVLAAAVSAGPPAALFKSGYNLCRAAPLSAIRTAGGQAYKRGVFANKSCLWLRSDLKAGVTLSTYPPAQGAAVMRQFLQMNGKSGFSAVHVKAPGAKSAVVVRLPHAFSKTVAKELLVAYPRGVVQVTMTAPRSVPTARLLAVLRAVT